MWHFDPLAGLNQAQAAAVSHNDGPLLVLAGAGSGKTRVLVHRLARFVAEGVPPHALMAVTFTNKAASEMRGRIEQLLGRSVQSMWLGTFHGLCHRFLRLHWQDAGLKENFQILDADDQERLIRRLMKELKLDDKAWPPKQVQGFINRCKDDGFRAQAVLAKTDRYSRVLGEVYAAYESACERANAVDFAELLLRTYEVLCRIPTIREHYRERFAHILVDEFQDTNGIQYRLLTSFVRPDGNLTAVGDDDQSIYGWRGARVENLRRLKEDYPTLTIVRLEQNYRSTQKILDAANAVIANNRDRLGKNLWTAGAEGEPIAVYQAFNEQEEARFIASCILQWVAQGGQWHDCAILYRSNALSRVLEEALLHAQIPYRIFGGLRFFERAEIKDALAYIRLIYNPDDDAAFERVVNTPGRAIGERTVAQLRDFARENSVSLWQAALNARDFLSARAANAVGDFVALIDQLRTERPGLALPELVRTTLERTGLMENYKKESFERWQARRENLQELVAATEEYSGDEWTEAGADPLGAFLAHAALEAGEHEASEQESAVQLMTLHAAKGLEFPWVCIAGMEEDLFPHHHCLGDPAQLEEERRLAYVGITRAKRALLLTWAEKRRQWGQESYRRPSRFIEEIPPQCRQEVRMGTRMNSAAMASANQTMRSTSSATMSGQWRVGQTVRHPKFGYGIVLSFEGEGAQARIQVNFEQAGSKWLVAQYARLEPIHR
ncbi:MAG: DNA helicase II [Gammaproteobacteria bacterium]|nr:MAG: DNA helicase II [Gammaproteobacteria bacterium]